MVGPSRNPDPILLDELLNESNTENEESDLD